MKSLTGVLIALVVPLGCVAPLSAQSAPRLFLVPQGGVATAIWAPATEARVPAVDAMTVGGQLEMHRGGAWNPLFAAHRWWLNERLCESRSECVTRGWSAETGVTHSFRPTSIFRPYGGAVVGVHHIGEARSYLQGRGGLDASRPGSAVTLRLEARYQEAFGGGAAFHTSSLSRLLLVTTGVRVLLPTP